jgi:hypothetical protein
MAELFLVLGTWGLVVVTYFMMRQQTALLRTDLKVRHQLAFADRFDSGRMLNDRKLLAQQLLSGARRGEIAEPVMDFFEDMGLFLRRGYLDEELLWSTFGFYAVRWWAACKNYNLEERKQQNDSTFFTDFELLANRFRILDRGEKLAEPTSSELQSFLRDESG